MNPLKSRSTIICVVCILAFLCFSEMVLAGGYFDAGFGAAGLMFLSGVVKYVFDHQAKNPVKPEEQSKEIKP